jgi:plastocyanin
LKHDVAIKGKGVSKKGKIVGLGGVSTVSATLKPGKYVFYCTVPGHEAAGMKGTLIVE